MALFRTVGREQRQGEEVGMSDEGMIEFATGMTIDAIGKLSMNGTPFEIRPWHVEIVRHMYTNDGHVSKYTIHRQTGHTTFLAALAVEAVRPGGTLCVSRGQSLYVAPDTVHCQHFLNVVESMLDDHDNIARVSPNRLRHRLNESEIVCLTCFAKEHEFRMAPVICMTDEVRKHVRHFHWEMFDQAHQTLKLLRHLHAQLVKGDPNTSRHLVEMN